MVKQEHPCVEIGEFENLWKINQFQNYSILDSVQNQLDHHTQQQQQQQQQQQSHHHQKQEGNLSVIVQPHDDSRDSSQILSPGPGNEIIDASDFRAMNEPTYQTLTSVNGRMSPPGFSPNSSYATLTPLQPLPPISTMSDKFAYGHGHGECEWLSTVFHSIQHNLKNKLIDSISPFAGLGVNSPYTYDKSPSMDISPPHSYSPLPQSIYSQNGLPSPQKSMSPGYESPYGNLTATTPTSQRQNGNGSAQEQASPASPPHSYSPLPTSVYNGMTTRQNGGAAQQNISINTSAPSPTLSAQSAELHSPSDQQMDKLWNGKMMDASGHHNGGGQGGFVQMGGSGGQHHMGGGAGQHHHNQNSRELLSGGAISPIPQGILRVNFWNFLNWNLFLKKNCFQSDASANSNTVATSKSSKLSSASLSLSSNDVEEINTKELAQRISAELKRYSIPQAIFAQRVLCRSQVRGGGI
jgi:hypothetical protein